jgi:hypothetical protein
MLFGGPIAWRSKLQSLVTQSSTESEYVSLAEMTNLLREYRPIYEWFFPARAMEAFKVLEDNQGAIKMAAKEEGTRRSKHIDIRYHVVKEAVGKKEIEIEYVATQDQLADLLTKNLGRVALERCRERIWTYMRHV